MNTHDMNALEYAAYVRMCLFFVMAGCAILTVALWAPIYCEWRKSKQK